MDGILPGIVGALFLSLTLVIFVFFCKNEIINYLQKNYCKHVWEDKTELFDDKGIKETLVQKCIYCNKVETRPLLNTNTCVSLGHKWKILESKKIENGHSGQVIGSIFYLQCSSCGEITSRKEKI